MLREARSLSRRADKLSSAAAVVDYPTTQHLVARLRLRTQAVRGVAHLASSSSVVAVPPVVAVPQRRLHPRFETPRFELLHQRPRRGCLLLCRLRRGGRRFRGGPESGGPSPDRELRPRHAAN